MKHTHIQLVIPALIVFSLAGAFLLSAPSRAKEAASKNQSVSQQALTDITQPQVTGEETRGGADLTPEYWAAVEAARPASEAYHRARNLYFEHRYDEAYAEAQLAVDLARKHYVGLIIEDGQRLQGKIRLAQGRYTEALELLKVKYMVGRSTILDLDIALCYVKLGDLAMAREFYTDNILLSYSSLSESDLPGTDTVQNFEASIRFAIGMDYYLASQEKAAFEQFVLAEALTPTVGAISYYAGMSLVYEGRQQDAKPYFERAVQNSSGRILESAQRRYQYMR